MFKEKIIKKIVKLLSVIYINYCEWRKFHKYRTGIYDHKGVCVCIKHKKAWLEGDFFEKNGGRACEECVRSSKIIKKNG